MKKILATFYMFIAVGAQGQTLQFCMINNFTSQIVQCFDNIATCQAAIDAHRDVYSCIAVQK